MEIVEKEKWQFRRSLDNASGCLLAARCQSWQLQSCWGGTTELFVFQEKWGRAGAGKGAQLNSAPELYLSEAGAGRAGTESALKDVLVSLRG